MVRKKYFTDFFINRILGMNKAQEALKDFIARQGGNKTVIANKLKVVTPQALGRYERGERSPGVEVFEAIKEIYGEDLLNPNQTVRENSDVVEIVEAFKSATDTFKMTLDSFNKMLESKDRQVAGLENDKKLLEDDKTWLKRQFETLTMSFNTLKQA
jgi:transcriptional regulator with XRE-family HTH domain